MAKIKTIIREFKYRRYRRKKAETSKKEKEKEKEKKGKELPSYIEKLKKRQEKFKKIW